MSSLPLSQLPRQTVARVSSLEMPEEDSTRLKAMGICVGRQIQLMRCGDPLILRVLGTRIGLSARLAGGIVVTKTEADSSEQRDIR